MKLHLAAWRETIIAHRPWEMVLMRLLLLYPLWKAVDRSVPAGGQPVPNGLAHFVDLGFWQNPAIDHALMWVFWLGAAFYLVDYAALAGLGAILAILISKGTLINSHGAIGHFLQLLTLVALGQWLVYLCAALHGWGRNQTQVLAVHWSKVIIAASYVSAAFSKIFSSSEFWVARTPYMALQVIKTNRQTYYNDLKTAISPLAEWFPYWVLEHRNLVRAFFAMGLLLELLAFLALINRRWAFVIGFLMIGFHYSVQLLMTLEFKNHVYLLLIYYINVPWLLWLGARWIHQRMAPAGTAAGSKLAKS